MPYFARHAHLKRPIPLGATVRFERSAEPVPHEAVVSAKVLGPPSTHGRDAARPSATRGTLHAIMHGQVWDYATPQAAWVVLPDQSARLVAVRDMSLVDGESGVDAALFALADAGFEMQA